MAHKSLIDGTAYEISSGKALIDGTAYRIKNGKTLVDGTAYEIGFSKTIDVTITGRGFELIDLAWYSIDEAMFSVFDEVALSLPEGSVIRLDCIVGSQVDFSTCDAGIFYEGAYLGNSMELTIDRPFTITFGAYFDYEKGEDYSYGSIYIDEL